MNKAQSTHEITPVKAIMRKMNLPVVGNSVYPCEVEQIAFESLHGLSFGLTKERYNG